MMATAKINAMTTKETLNERFKDDAKPDPSKIRRNSSHSPPLWLPLHQSGCWPRLNW